MFMKCVLLFVSTFVHISKYEQIRDFDNLRFWPFKILSFEILSFEIFVFLNFDFQKKKGIRSPPKR